jgi:hypothetical protein
MMLAKLQARGAALGDAAVSSTIATVQARLRAVLPPGRDIQIDTDRLVIDTATGLTDMVQHSELRDVAFLLRSAR